MADIQELIKQEKEAREGIEIGQVQIQKFSIQIDELEEGTKMLTNKKEDLEDKKKETALHNESLEKDVKAKRETEMKRLKATIEKQKGPHMKELTQRVEDNSENNEEFRKKLREESEKHDQLIDDVVELREKFRLAKEQFDEVTVKIEKETEELKTLKDKIKVDQTEHDALLKKVEEARKVNLFEEEKNRKYSKANAALTAKLDFIEQKYDTSSAAEKLEKRDFDDLIASNINVNTVMETFKGKLDIVKAEIKKREAEMAMKKDK